MRSPSLDSLLDKPLKQDTHHMQISAQVFADGHGPGLLRPALGQALAGPAGDRR